MSERLNSLQAVSVVPWDVLLGTCGTCKTSLDNKGEGVMLYQVASKKDINRVCDDLQTAITKRQFGVMAVHNLTETMKKKGVDFERDCRIFEVCNPHKAKEVLMQQMAISTALPCRISVYTEGNQVVLATLKPTVLMTMFEGVNLEELAQEVESVMVDSMNEAAGR
jgi:uncharacterized protein (DUF302 family)